MHAVSEFPHAQNFRMEIFSYGTLTYEIIVERTILVREFCERNKGKLRYVKKVVTKTRNEMEQNRLFCPVLFRILHPEAIQSLSLNPKNFNLVIPNPESELFC